METGATVLNKRRLRWVRLHVVSGLIKTADRETPRRRLILPQLPHVIRGKGILDIVGRT